MTTNNELHEGDTVRIVGPHRQNPYRGVVTYIESIGRMKTGTWLYLVYIPYAGTFLYERDEIERVTPEESRGVV